MVHPTPILMSAENPTGWKLEELLRQIIKEVALKNKKVTKDKQLVARTVEHNNTMIMTFLTQACAMQMHSLDMLATLGPDPGPVGIPRIGIGSRVTPLNSVSSVAIADTGKRQRKPPRSKGLKIGTCPHGQNWDDCPECCH